MKVDKILHGSLWDRQIINIGIYAPNSNLFEFWNEVSKNLQYINCEYVLLLGDFNAVMHMREDNSCSRIDIFASSIICDMSNCIIGKRIY